METKSIEIYVIYLTIKHAYMNDLITDYIKIDIIILSKIYIKKKTV